MWNFQLLGMLYHVMIMLAVMNSYFYGSMIRVEWYLALDSSGFFINKDQVSYISYYTCLSATLR